MSTVQTANEYVNQLLHFTEYYTMCCKKIGGNLQAEILTMSFSLGSLLNDRLRVCRGSKCHFTVDFKVSKLGFVPNKTISIFLQKMKR